MTWTVALDPGIRGVGISLFCDRTLAAADYLKNTVPRGDEPEAVLEMAFVARDWTIQRMAADNRLGAEKKLVGVIEWPQVYLAGKSKGDNNDLLPLAGVGAAFLMSLLSHPLVTVAETKRVKPREWKGQLTKEATDLRVRARLDTYEATVLEHACARAKSLAHNLIDAVGIGLHAVGRFDPVRVFPR